MKKKLFVVVLSAVVLSASAQYIPHNSQAYQFYPVLNPAFSGVENFGDLKLSYRYQWAGFKGAPEFLNLSYNSRIKQPLDMAYNSLRVSNASALSGRQFPRAKGMLLGFGVNLFEYRGGVVQSVGGSLNFSVNYPITEIARLAVGAAALVENRKLNIGQVKLRDEDPYYEHLLTSSTSQTDLNLRLGALLYTEAFYFGLSYLPVVNVAVQSSELAMEQPFYRGSFQVGYSVPVSEEITLKPSVVGLWQMNNKFAIDYNLKAFIQDKVIAGLSYRTIKSGVAILGFNLNPRFTFTYSYEMSFGNFQKFNDGSHELVIAARIKNLRKQTQYLW